MGIQETLHVATTLIVTLPRVQLTPPHRVSTAKQVSAICFILPKLRRVSLHTQIYIQVQLKTVQVHNSESFELYNNVLFLV